MSERLIYVVKTQGDVAYYKRQIKKAGLTGVSVRQAKTDEQKLQLPILRDRQGILYQDAHGIVSLLKTLSLA